MNDTPSNADRSLEYVGIQNIVSIDSLNKNKLPISSKRKEMVPEQVDLSKYLHFIRKQGGLGCWGYSFLAMWDIMNVIVCPYSPNLSFRLWKMIFYKHQLWGERGDVFSPDGCYHDVKSDQPDADKRCGALNKGDPPFFTSFGCTTEGTDPS